MRIEPISANTEREIRGMVEDSALFRGMPGATLDSLLSICHKIIWEYGDRILFQGAPPTGLILIGEGTVEVTATTDEASTVMLASLTTGATLGEVGTMQDANSTANVTATAAGWGLFFPKEELLQVLKTFPRATERLTRLINARAGHTLAKLRNRE